MTGKKKQDDKQTPVNEIKSELEFHETHVDKVALFITNMFGSMKFLAMCLVFFIIWIAWNMNWLPLLKPFDPYPFQMLEMIVSLFAIFLSVSVLITQNREGRRDSIRQKVEFEVNIRAEREITKMLTMLHEIQKKMGVVSKIDIELEEMKAETDIKEIHHLLDDTAADDETKL